MIVVRFIMKNVKNYESMSVYIIWNKHFYACPHGWLLPSNEEWVELEKFLIENKYYYDEGEKTGIAKSLAATSGWKSYSQFSVKESIGKHLVMVLLA